MNIKEITVKLARKEGRPNYGSDERAITLTAALEAGEDTGNAVSRLRSEARRSLAALWNDNEAVQANPLPIPAAPAVSAAPVAAQPAVPVAQRPTCSNQKAHRALAFLDDRVAEFSQSRYGRHLCRDCQASFQPVRR